MKSSVLALAIMALSFSAFATNGNNGEGNGGCGVGQQTNGCGSTSNGGAGGAGGQGGAGGSVLGSGNSSNANVNTNLAAQQQGQGQAQGQFQQATGGASNASAFGGFSNATGGSADASVSGLGSGNSTSVQIAAPVIPKPASANAYAPEGSAPRTSCRIFIGIGGTGREGSLSGGIPVGNDQTCLSGAQVEFMNNVNRVAPGTFTGADYLLAACKVEGMDQMAACRK